MSAKCWVVCDISSGKSWYRRQCCAVVKRGPFGDSPAVEKLYHRGHVEAQAGDGVGKLMGGFLELRAVLGDHVPEDGEEQFVLAGEEPVERLQRDAGFLDQLLDREAVAALGDEPTGGVMTPFVSSICRARERCTTGDRSAARSADGRFVGTVLMTARVRRPGSPGRCASGTRRSWASTSVTMCHRAAASRRGGGARHDRDVVAPHLDLGLGVAAEVQVPGRVSAARRPSTRRRGSRRRRGRRSAPTYGLPAASAGRGEQQRRHAVPEVTDLAVGLSVAADVLLAEQR